MENRDRDESKQDETPADTGDLDRDVVSGHGQEAQKISEPENPEPHILIKRSNGSGRIERNH